MRKEKNEKEEEMGKLWKEGQEIAEEIEKAIEMWKD